MIPVIMDLLVLLVLAFCIWRGWRKGLILTAAGILSLVIAVWGGYYLSGKFADTVSDKVQPLLDWVTDGATDEALREQNRNPDVTGEEKDLAVARQALGTLGISDKEADNLAEKAVLYMQEAGTTVRTGVSAVFIRTVCGVILFIFFFAIITLILTLLAHFVSMLFTLPGLKLVDTVGGLAAGLLYGCLILFAVGWVLRFLGILIPAEMIESTFVTRFFVNVNPLARLL